jgi:hypothetical protein
MKLVYNLGGINHARNALRIDHRSYKQRSYTSSEKMQIVQAVDRLVEKEYLPQNVAAGRYPRQGRRGNLGFNRIHEFSKGNYYHTILITVELRFQLVLLYYFLVQYKF